MTSPSNTLAIDRFKKRKETLDEQLQHLQSLSQHNFGIEEGDISHSHCGELMYYSYQLEDIIHTILNRNTTT